MNYNKTLTACFIGYVVQAVINNFLPLLFLTLQGEYGIPLGQITLLITFNFGVQLAVDLLSALFVDRIGYRTSIVAAHVFATAGLASLAVLPGILPPFVGLLVSVMLYGVGGGLIEVLVSPITESCPTPHKARAMSLLHSFYCWGQVAVVLLSTLFFRFVGISHWRVLAVLWALLPAGNAIAFLRAPIAPLVAENEESLPLPQLLRRGMFWVLVLMMVCAGASELAVSQWASFFAEKGLGLGKLGADLTGPMLFAVLMGGARAFYGKWGDRIPLDAFMTGSSLLCVCAYLLTALCPSPVLNLVGCALCGLSVGILWPGTFSKAAASLRRGGTALFSLLALAGDVGCTAGPTLVGLVSGGDMHRGILLAGVFPALLAAVLLLGRMHKKAA